MKIDLPDIEIQPEWTIGGQLKKLFEEAGEVAEAVTIREPIETIKEALDTMQTCATLINMVLEEWDISLDRFLTEHKEKLERKGYLNAPSDS
jgi:NTP pyrophosphatase (non-canonical NTP hydrolase)